MKRCAAISGMILCAVMTWVSPVAAQDVIGYWNELTLATVSQAAPAGRGACTIRTACAGGRTEC